MSIANDIRTKSHGKEVREAIALGIEDVESIIASYDAQVINAGNSNAEIVDARGNFARVKDRLNGFDINLDDKATKAELQSVASGAPKTTYTTLVALQAGVPAGNTNSYVLADGHRYYWNGSSWTDGGIYQSAGIADNSVTNAKIANYAIGAEKMLSLYPMWRSINMLKGGGKPIVINSTLKTLTFPADAYDTLMYVGESLRSNVVPATGLVIDLSVMVGTSAWCLLYSDIDGSFLSVPYSVAGNYKTTHAIFATCRISGGKYIFNMPCPYILDGLLYGNTYTSTDIDTKLQNVNIIEPYVLVESVGVADILLDKQKEKSCSFAFLTDMHYNDYYTVTTTKHAMQSLNKISQKSKIDFVCFGGDNVGNRPTKPEQLQSTTELREFTNRYIDIPVIAVKGNHDDNSVTGMQHGNLSGYEVLDSEYYVRLFKDNENKNNVVFDEENRSGLYCYKDLPDSKIRVIFLNSVDIPHIINGDGTMKYKGQSDFAYSDKQLNWVANKALDFSDKATPSEWGVITMQHITCVPVTGFFQSVTYNGQAMFDIFKAFKNKTSYSVTTHTTDFAYSVDVDFTNKQGELITMISGHGHSDWDGIVDNILHITSINASTNEYGNVQAKDGNTYAKVPGTADETGYDIFTIDKFNRKIYATRYGVGVDREWTY